MEIGKEDSLDTLSVRYFSPRPRIKAQKLNGRGKNKFIKGSLWIGCWESRSP
jgi:hypothetical protein